MEPLPRVDPDEDPYLALRTMLGVVLCALLAEPVGISQPMLPIAIGMSMLSNQRGGLNVRTFAGPIALPIIAVVFSWLAAVTVGEPAIFIIVNIVLAIGGLALLLFRGSRAGMLLTVFPAMMSISALYSEYALAMMRDSMVAGGLLVGVAAIVTNIVFPPKTRRIHVENPRPLQSDYPVRELLIRAFVYITTLIATYATNNMALLIVPIMLVFICAEPDRGGRMEQVVDRGGGTVVGGIVATIALAIYHIVPQFPVLILLIGVITYFLIDKMTTGRGRPQYYQYICSVALVMILSSTVGTNSAFEVVFQRIVLTVGIMMAGIVLLSLLETIFVPKKSEPDLPAVANLA